MNKTTIWEILDQVYEKNNKLRLSVLNKTKDITIDGYGRPAPIIGNLEEIYKKNKNKVDKTVKELVNISEAFIEKERKRMEAAIKKKEKEESNV